MMNLFWCRSEKYGDSLFAYGREGDGGGQRTEKKTNLPSARNLVEIIEMKV